MDEYCAEIRKLGGKFYGIEYHHVVWANNQAVDELSKIGIAPTRRWMLTVPR